MKRPFGLVVPPRSSDNIFKEACVARQVLNRLAGGGDYVRIDRIYEILPKVMPGFRMEVCDEVEMGGDHGQTYPDDLLIKLRADVYDGMCRGVGRDRFTGAHELGHLFLHQGAAKFARRRTEEVPVYRDAEWQSDEFASEFLIERARMLTCQSVAEIVQVFGVSEAAAAQRFRKRK